MKIIIEIDEMGEYSDAMKLQKRIEVNTDFEYDVEVKER